MLTTQIYAHLDMKIWKSIFLFLQSHLLVSVVKGTGMKELSVHHYGLGGGKDLPRHAGCSLSFATLSQLWNAVQNFHKSQNESGFFYSYYFQVACWIFSINSSWND